MKTLTLEQVYAAGVTAKWFGEQCGVKVTITIFGPKARYAQATWAMDPAPTDFKVTIPEDGWIHRTDCDCELCSP